MRLAYAAPVCYTTSKAISRAESSPIASMSVCASDSEDGNQMGESSMYLEQSQHPSQQQQVNISAKLIASIKILQLSAEELEQSIAQEAFENPAFEMEELGQCQRCGAQMKDGMCSTCGGTVSTAQADGTHEWDDFSEPGVVGGDEEDFDPLARVQDAASLEEVLLWQMQIGRA